MKKIYSRSLLLGALLATSALAPSSAKAQYAEMVNQIPQLLSPALSGSMNYKGFVDVTGTFGFGDDRANFVGISTSQGFQYASWFFMGVGIGVDVAMSPTNHPPYGGGNPDPGYVPGMATTKAMLPIFSDFRFNIGGNQGISFFADIKAGATWLLGDSYLQLNNGSLSTSAQFLLRPSIGLRVPVNSKNPRQAFNIGVTYQLITANNTWGYWSTSSYDTTLNSVGLSAGFEW